MPLVRVSTVTGYLSGREKKGLSLFTSATGQQMPKRETMAPAMAALTCHFPLQEARPAKIANGSALPANAHACNAANMARTSLTCLLLPLASCLSLATSCLLPVSLTRVGAPPDSLHMVAPSNETWCVRQPTCTSATSKSSSICSRASALWTATHKSDLCVADD